MVDDRGLGLVRRSGQGGAGSDHLLADPRQPETATRSCTLKTTILSHSDSIFSCIWDLHERLFPTLTLTCQALRSPPLV